MCIRDRLRMEQLSFFDREEEQPLASRLRPRTLEEYVGPVSYTHLDVYKRQVPEIVVIRNV